MQKYSYHSSSKLGHIFLSGLLVFVFILAGCGDNPESKAAKAVQEKTQSAVQESLTEKDYAAHRQKVLAAVGRHRVKEGPTKDSASLASGNFAFAHACQMQTDLSLKRLPLRGSLDRFEKLLRSAEQLFVEKSKLNILLSAGDQEVVELKQLIAGDSQNPGLTKELQQLSSQMEALLAEKTALEKKQQQLQRVLDDYQAKADGFLREAELAEGDHRLSLEQQAFELLKQRKEQYIEIQAAENQIGILNIDIELLQTRLGGARQNIDEIRSRIEGIESSETRSMLKGQLRDIDQAISTHQKNLTSLTTEINEGFRSYQELAEQVRSVFNDAVGEYEKIRSRIAHYTSALGQAKCAYQAAFTCQEQIRTQAYLAGRFEGLMDLSGSDDVGFSEYVTFISAIKSRIAIPAEIKGDLKTEAFELFNKSIAAYEDAESKAGGIGSDARCSMVKSRLLALYSKMKLADFLSEYDLATETEVTLDEVIQKGTELGDCFTQSEALQIVQAQGLNYMPAIPLNMQVFTEGKKQELSMWKQLPVSEREAAVDRNLLLIEELTQQHGQDFARQLESVKQEMLAAKKSGFKESVSSGPGDPNSF